MQANVIFRSGKINNLNFSQKISQRFLWEEERQVENSSREMNMSGGCKDFAATKGGNAMEREHSIQCYKGEGYSKRSNKNT